MIEVAEIFFKESSTHLEDRVEANLDSALLGIAKQGQRAYFQNWSYSVHRTVL